MRIEDRMTERAFGETHEVLFNTENIQELFGVQ